MPDQRTIWKRRAALMAVVGLVVAIPVTIVIRGGNDDDDPAPAPALEVPEVGRVEFDRDLGVELRLPEGWKRKREKEVVSFASPDKGTLIAVSTPGPAEDVIRIHKAAIASVKSQYRAVEVVTRESKQRLGGRPAEVAAISARHPKKDVSIRILVATAKGEKLAYLTEVFASGGAGLVEAQVLLNNLKLEG